MLLQLVGVKSLRACLKSIVKCLDRKLSPRLCSRTPPNSLPAASYYWSGPAPQVARRLSLSEERWTNRSSATPWIYCALQKGLLRTQSRKRPLPTPSPCALGKKECLGRLMPSRSPRLRVPQASAARGTASHIDLISGTSGGFYLIELVSSYAPSLCQTVFHVCPARPFRPFCGTKRLSLFHGYPICSTLKYR